MQYDQFEKTLERFPCGRYTLNSCQLRELLQHKDCTGIGVRVLHLGTFLLDRADLLERLRDDLHPRLDGIKVTCLDGEVIIDQPSHGAP